MSYELAALPFQAHANYGTWSINFGYLYYYIFSIVFTLGLKQSPRMTKKSASTLQKQRVKINSLSMAAVSSFRAVVISSDSLTAVLFLTTWSLESMFNSATFIRLHYQSIIFLILYIIVID